MLPSDEKEEMFDDWEDDEGFPGDDADIGGFPEETADGSFDEASSQQQKPVKKKGGGGIFLFLLILLGGVGGGIYFLTTSAGTPYRDYLPEAVRGFLPASQTPQPAVAGASKGADGVAAVLDGNLKVDSAVDTMAKDADIFGMQAPPMPSLSDTGTAAVGENAEESTLSSFGTMSEDNSGTDTEEVVDDAWGSETPSEESATALSFGGDETTAAEDNLTAVVDDTVPAAMDTAKTPDNNMASFSAAGSNTPAIKTENMIDLEDRMSVLENAVHGLEKTVVTKKDMSGLKNDVSSLQAEIKALRSELKKASSVSRNISSTPKTATSSTTGMAVEKPVAAVKTTPKREWVMVSAQPGTAWISEKGSNSKREVSVGDTVPGLGRITSIAPSAGTGRWIIQGTAGTLAQ